jgi:hypothetical protein
MCYRNRGSNGRKSIGVSIVTKPLSGKWFTQRGN